MNHKLRKAYDDAIKFTHSHYENFPVISSFLDSNYKDHIAIIYKFAREADDFADEDIYEDSQRENLLDEYLSKFENCINGSFDSDYWLALKNTIDEKNINPINFKNLISAFKQDIKIKRYSNFENLTDYCCRSANPVGRLILELFGFANDRNYYLSDQICTALQLTNFWQDISVDLKKGRIYIPQEDFKSFNYTEEKLLNSIHDDNFKQLIQFEIDRTRKMFSEGRALVKNLRGRLKFQIKLTILGGEEILKKIEKNKSNIINERPKLRKFDYISMLIKSLYRF